MKGDRGIFVDLTKNRFARVSCVTHAATVWGMLRVKNITFLQNVTGVACRMAVEKKKKQLASNLSLAIILRRRWRLIACTVSFWSFNPMVGRRSTAQCGNNKTDTKTDVTQVTQWTSGWHFGSVCERLQRGVKRRTDRAQLKQTRRLTKVAAVGPQLIPLPSQRPTRDPTLTKNQKITLISFNYLFGQKLSDKHRKSSINKEKKGFFRILF